MNTPMSINFEPFPDHEVTAMDNLIADSYASQKRTQTDHPHLRINLFVERIQFKAGATQMVKTHLNCDFADQDKFKRFRRSTELGYLRTQIDEVRTGNLQGHFYTFDLKTNDDLEKVADEAVRCGVKDFDALQFCVRFLDEDLNFPMRWGSTYAGMIGFSDLASASIFRLGADISEFIHART